MSTPPSGKDRHPAARTLAERLEDVTTGGADAATTNGEVDKILACSPEASEPVSRRCPACSSVTLTLCPLSDVSFLRIN